jgi:integrase
MRTTPSLSPTTRELNIHAMNQILGTNSSDGALTIDWINGDAVRAWFSAANARANSLDDQTAQISAKRSANSRCNQAASLCAPKALDCYRSKSIPTAGLVDFAKTYLVCRFSRLPAISFNPPNEELIKKTLAAWEVLPDGNLFRTIGLALAFGLRKEEITQTRWDWFTNRAGYPVLDSTAEGASVTVKNLTGILQVRALDPYYSIFRAKAKPAAREKTVLTGYATWKNDAVFRTVSHWLENLGWNTRKATHALRAYAGSQVAMKYGIYEAQIFLRHSTVKVTENHYSYFVKRFRPADLDAVPARWAEAPPAVPVLRVLEAANN